MKITNNKIEPTGSSIKVNSETSIAVTNRGVYLSYSGVEVLPDSGDIIEGLWSLCDGSTHVLTSRTYTVENVNSVQSLDNTHRDITGSSISYVPPAGTTKVVYSFSFSNYWVTGGHGISHYKFVIEGDDVIYSRNNRSTSQYLESRYAFEWVIPIGGVADVNTGRQSSWTTPKTLKMQARDYSSGGNDANLHGTRYWDGPNGPNIVFSMPIISILALR